MSGPKTSRYTLTPEQRRLLEEQRKLEQRKAVAKAKLQAAHKQLLQLGSTLDAHRQVAGALGDRDGGLGQLIGQLDQVLAPVQPLVAATDQENVTSLEDTARQLQQQLDQAQKLLRQVDAVSSQAKADLMLQLDAAIDQGFAPVQQIAPASTGLRQQALEKLQALAQLPQLPQEYRQRIDQAMDRVEATEQEEFLKNLVALTVNPLIRQVQQYQQEAAQCREVFRELETQYRALCRLHGYTPREYPCTQASVEALREQLQQLQEEVAQDDEQAYIRDCLDAVMAEMGYDVLGSREVTKKSGRRFRSALYAYAEGTAVNVTCSSDGRIAMELGGLDTQDRLPNDRETAALCHSMEQFCSDFPEIERRLRQKGVVLAQRISMLPVDAQYAQIINTSDYQMTGQASLLKKKRRTVQTPKARRKE